MKVTYKNQIAQLIIRDNEIVQESNPQNNN